MRKLLVAILSLSLVFGGLSVPTASIAAEVGATTSATVDTSVQQGQIAVFSDLKALFSAETVDLAAVKAKYVSDIQADVVASNPQIDELIVQTLDLAIAGNLNTGQAKQAIDKGLQWFFYSEITNLTKVVAKNALKAGDKEAASVAFEQAVVLYEGSLAGTATKRDSAFAADLSVTTRSLLDDTVIPGMRAAIQNNNLDQYNVLRQMLDKTLIKVFYLATITYAEKAPRVAQTDLEKGKVGVTEGFFFFMPIYGSLSSVDKVSADYIRDAFASGDPAQLDAEKIKAAFVSALIAKTSGYVNKTIGKDLASGNINAAMEHAMEGNMFLAALEVSVKQELGIEAFEAAKVHAEHYFNAVVDGNAKAATQHSFNYLKILSQLNGTSFTIGTNELTVNGQAKQAVVASYLNKDTNRTLVPIRFFEEMGAKVDWVAETRTVVIEKDGVKTELVVGSNVIKNNGVALDKVLDQVVELKGDRSFIPVRDIATLFGSKVFYFNGEVVVVK